MGSPSAPISIAATVDIGHGRGRLARGPAASIWRIDAQLGRPADINDAWRSPEQADRNRAAWIAFLNGGPSAPYALDRWGSIHCRGYAGDSDDWYDAACAAVWRRNGWRQTALYPVGDSRREVWHGEYDEALDEFLGGIPAGSGSAEFKPPSIQEEDMATLITGGGQSLVVGNQLVGFTSTDDVNAVKGAQVLEVSPKTHYDLITAYQRAGGAGLPVRVFVVGEPTVYLLADGKLSPLVDPHSLERLASRGGGAVELSRAEVDNLLAVQG